MNSGEGLFTQSIPGLGNCCPGQRNISGNVAGVYIRHVSASTLKWCSEVLWLVET